MCRVWQRATIASRLDLAKATQDVHAFASQNAFESDSDIRQMLLHSERSINRYHMRGDFYIPFIPIR